MENFFYVYYCNRSSKNFKEKNKKANSWEKIGEKFNLSCLFMNIFPYFLWFWSLRCRLFWTKQRNVFACNENSSSMSAMLFALIFPRAKRASTIDIFAERNVWLQSALRSFAIVCDYMETALFAIVCDRSRSYGNQPLQIVPTTIKESLESWFTNSEQTALNHCQPGSWSFCGSMKSP